MTRSLTNELKAEGQALLTAAIAAENAGNPDQAAHLMTQLYHIEKVIGPIS